MAHDTSYLTAIIEVLHFEIIEKTTSKYTAYKMSLIFVQIPIHFIVYWVQCKLML